MLQQTEELTTLRSTVDRQSSTLATLSTSELRAREALTEAEKRMDIVRMDKAFLQKEVSLCSAHYICIFSRADL